MMVYGVDQSYLYDNLHASALTTHHLMSETQIYFCKGELHTYRHKAACLCLCLTLLKFTEV